MHHICRTGTFALSEFSRSRASEDLGTDRDTRRPLASERQNGVGDYWRDRDRRQRSEPGMSDHRRDEQRAVGSSQIGSLTGPLSLSLRADRNGLGAGRIYSIAVTCTNASELSASGTVTVLVPHDRR